MAETDRCVTLRDMGYPAWVLDLEALGGPPLVLRASTHGYIRIHRGGEAHRVLVYSPRRINALVSLHGERWQTELIREADAHLRRP